MFALRGLPQARAVARLPRQAAVFQQKRGMAGGGGQRKTYANMGRRCPAGSWGATRPRMRAEIARRAALRSRCGCAPPLRRLRTMRPLRSRVASLLLLIVPLAARRRGRGRQHVCELVGQPHQPGLMAQAPGALERAGALWLLIAGRTGATKEPQDLDMGAPAAALQLATCATPLRRNDALRSRCPLELTACNAAPVKTPQLAWWGVAFWGAVFYTAFGGKKKAPTTEEVAKA